MTEIDRIKNERWLSNSFFLPEKKCGFLITKERKELWAILLDLFKEFIRVCSKYNLKWYAVGGTLLGAVRHHGFIPWDDDLDVAMPRKDYEKLKTLKKEFLEPYFLGWPEVEEENGFSFLQLRNSNTTGTSKAFFHLNMNHGIFLDIYPIDEVNIMTYDEDQERMKILTVENTLKMKDLNGKNKGRAYVDVYHDIEKLAQKDNGKNYGYVSERVITLIPKEKLLWRKEDFSDIEIYPFENIQINIPIGWERILTTVYGEWRNFPPVETRGVWHSNAIFDPLTPYQNYKEK